MRMSLGFAVVAVSSVAAASLMGIGVGGQPAARLHAVTAVDSTYRITPLEVPGATFTTASDITDAGMVVGFFGRDTAVTLGFIHDGRGFTTVEHPGAARTRVTSMAADGTLAGSFRVPGSPGYAWRGFVRRPSGEFVAVGHDDYPYGMAQRVLDNGTVVGCVHGANMNATMRGLVFSSGRGSPSILVGSKHNGASQDGRRVVGTVAGDTRSYELEGERVTYIERPGFATTEAWDVNEAGTIVGAAIDSSRRTSAFVREGGRWTTLDIPGSTSSVAFGINRRGDVVGAWVDQAGRRLAFIARRERR